MIPTVIKTPEGGDTDEVIRRNWVRKALQLHTLGVRAAWPSPLKPPRPAAHLPPGSRLLLCSHKWRKCLAGFRPAVAFGIGVCSRVKCIWLSFLEALNHLPEPSLRCDNPHIRRPGFWAPEASLGRGENRRRKGLPGLRTSDPGWVVHPGRGSNSTDSSLTPLLSSVTCKARVLRCL